jgi:hypothetical protein
MSYWKCALLLLVVSVGDVWGQELKGFTMGMSPQQVRVLAGNDYVCDPDPLIGECTYYVGMQSNYRVEHLETVAGVRPMKWTFKFYENKLVLVHVAFSENFYSEVLEAVRAKWGRGKSKNSILQNRMGAKVQQVETEWGKGDVTLYCQRFAGSIDTSVLFLVSESGAKKIQAAEQKAAKSKAKDL